MTLHNYLNRDFSASNFYKNHAMISTNAAIPIIPATAYHIHSFYQTKFSLISRLFETFMKIKL